MLHMHMQGANQAKPDPCCDNLAAALGAALF
jgi:hypothetical protein